MTPGPRKAGATEYWVGQATVARMPGEPLALAELLDAEGEPIWVERCKGGERIAIHWDYVDRVTSAYKARLCRHAYGKTWPAYRNRL